MSWLTVFNRSIVLLFLFILAHFVVIKVISYLKRHENLWMFILVVITSIPINFYILLQLHKLNMIFNSFYVLGILRCVLYYCILFSVEEIIMGVLTRMIWEKCIKLICSLNNLDTIRRKNMNNKVNSIFENYIVSDCNEEAYRTCASFLDDPSGKFIALFGPNLSGKTYLLSSLQKAYQSKFPGAKVHFTTFDELIFEYMEVLYREDKGRAYLEFRADLSDNDLLIVDNMQFVAGKTYTQEEFSTWFASMIHNNKSVLLSFDRPATCFDKLFDVIKNRCPDCCVVELKAADSNFKKQYMDVLLEEMKYDSPLSVKNALIYDSAMPFHSFYGYISKIHFLEKIVGCNLSTAEMFECLSDYK